jgi:hypothetical protein
MVSGNSEITRLQVTIATMFLTLAGCMNVNNVIGHEQARSLLFQGAVSIL